MPSYRTTRVHTSTSITQNGNRIGGGGSTYTGDVFNRLPEVRQGGVLVAEYFYDAEDRRVEKKVHVGPVGEARFVYAGVDVVAEHGVRLEDGSDFLCEVMFHNPEGACG